MEQKINYNRRIEEPIFMILNDDFKKYFDLKGLLLPKSIKFEKKKIPLTYDTILGLGYNEQILSEYNSDPELHYAIDGYPFEINNKEARKKSKIAIQKIFEFIHKKKGRNLKHVDLEYMTVGRTVPIRIFYSWKADVVEHNQKELDKEVRKILKKNPDYKTIFNKNKNKKLITKLKELNDFNENEDSDHDLPIDIAYAKKGDIKRVVGAQLYNLISGEDDEKFEFYFNEDLVFQPAVTGEVASHFDKKSTLQIEKYVIGLAEFQAYAKMINLASDYTNDNNRIINFGNFKSHCCDFNNIFNSKDSRSTLLDSIARTYPTHKVKYINEDIYEAYRNKKHQIASNIKKNWEEIKEFCYVAGKNELNATNHTINEFVQRATGKKSLLKLIEFNYANYRNA